MENLDKLKEFEKTFTRKTNIVTIIYMFKAINLYYLMHLKTCGVYVIKYISLN